MNPCLANNHTFTHKSPPTGPACSSARRSEREKDQPPLVGRLSPSLFWDTDWAKVDPVKHRRWILQRVLERGSWTDWQRGVVFSFINTVGFPVETTDYLNTPVEVQYYENHQWQSHFTRSDHSQENHELDVVLEARMVAGDGVTLPDPATEIVRHAGTADLARGDWPAAFLARAGGTICVAVSPFTGSA